MLSRFGHRACRGSGSSSSYCTTAVPASEKPLRWCLPERMFEFGLPSRTCECSLQDGGVLADSFLVEDERLFLVADVKVTI